MNRRLCLLLPAIIFSGLIMAQIPLTVLSSGGNKKASVSERIGLTDVTIHYDRPGVKGREGKIWGQLIAPGFNDLGFGNTKAAPWRAGSNENTTIEFTSAVKIEGQALPAGKYGFFIAYDPNECTLIFSHNSNSWGSYFYDDKEDALRVKVKPVTIGNSVEWLKYEFSNQKEAAATISLQWEKLSIPFNVEVDYVNSQLESFRKELRTDRGFMWESWDQAAAWCVQHDVNLEQALAWSDSATSTNFGGDHSFTTWSTKAQILAKLNRGAESAEIMKKALPLGNINEIHQYGRQLLQEKKSKEALEVFKLNYQKNPNQFTTLMGLARGYSATGDFKSALKYAKQALPLSPNAQNTTNVQGLIEKLSAGKDINE